MILGPEMLGLGNRRKRMFTLGFARRSFAWLGAEDHISEFMSLFGRCNVLDGSAFSSIAMQTSRRTSGA